MAGRNSYYAYRAGAEVARRLPAAIGAPAARGIARAVGLGVMRTRAHQVERNLTRVNGAPMRTGSRTRAVAGTFDSYGRYFYELFRLPGATPEWLNAHTDAIGFEHIRSGLDAGRGVLLALPHVGNWDFGGAWLAAQGVPVTAIAEPLEPPELFDWFARTRSELGIRVVPLSANAGGDVLRALAANEVVCLLCDRDLTGDGIPVDFFGERTTLPGGPALTALRSGAPLVPAVSYFRPHARQRVEIGPPLATERTGRLRDDVTRITQDLAHRFERIIRAEPEQWHLMQPNWPSDRG